MQKTKVYNSATRMHYAAAEQAIEPYVKISRRSNRNWFVIVKNFFHKLIYYRMLQNSTHTHTHILHSHFLQEKALYLFNDTLSRKETLLSTRQNIVRYIRNWKIATNTEFPPPKISPSNGPFMGTFQEYPKIPESERSFNKRSEDTLDVCPPVNR